MKRLIQSLPLLLAALLQLMPLMRNIITNPANASTIAVIMRWGIGAGAVVGAYDARSASSLPYFLPFQTNIAMTVGVYFTNSIVVTNTGTDPHGYFELTNTVADSGQILPNGTTTVCLPPGIILKNFDRSSSHYLYAAIYGTPTTVQAAAKVNVDAGYSGAGDIYTNIFFTVLAGGTAPAVTSQPAGVTNVAGGSASFSVTATGTAPLAYQWRLAGANLTGATTTPLNLSQIRTSQAGNYTVVITNSLGAITSSVAMLGVTTPLPPTITSPAKNGSGFQFTFVPIVGLTNTVQANGAVNGAWTTFSNVAPPVSASPVTVTDAIGNSNRFYRVMVQP